MSVGVSTVLTQAAKKRTTCVNRVDPKPCMFCSLKPRHRDVCFRSLPVNGSVRCLFCMRTKTLDDNTWASHPDGLDSRARS